MMMTMMIETKQQKQQQEQEKMMMMTATMMMTSDRQQLHQQQHSREKIRGSCLTMVNVLVVHTAAVVKVGIGCLSFPWKKKTHLCQ